MLSDLFQGEMGCSKERGLFVGFSTVKNVKVFGYICGSVRRYIVEFGYSEIFGRKCG